MGEIQLPFTHLSENGIDAIIPPRRMQQQDQGVVQQGQDW